jgi:hypothetical protein
MGLQRLDFSAFAPLQKGRREPLRSGEVGEAASQGNDTRQDTAMIGIDFLILVVLLRIIERL